MAEEVFGSLAEKVLAFMPRASSVLNEQRFLEHQR